jgi:hydroxymethylglutaryl-CoA lyase
MEDNFITIVEVGPRDGFQSIKEWIPTKTKLMIIKALYEAGFTNMEVGAFVSPKAIAQMRDASTIVQELKEYPTTVLVPNLYGAKAAFEAGAKAITYVVSVSKSHNMANVRRTPQESLEALKEIKQAYPSLHVKLALATSFGCPFEGEIPIKAVANMVRFGQELNVDEICLADTIGIANPIQVQKTLKALMPQIDRPLGLHLHDTRGMGLANAFAAINEGVSMIESAVGGIGGCPFAPGAAGNIASEDLVNMLHSMGFKTSIDLDKLLKVSELIKKHVSPTLFSRMANLPNSTCKGVSCGK